MYLGLTQSNADEDKLVAWLDHASMYPTRNRRRRRHPVEIVYEGDGVEPVWTTRLGSPAGPAQIAVTGAGGVGQFRTLATATQSQPPPLAGRRR